MHYKYTDIKAIVAEILENKKDEGGVKNIYFVGCGGSLVLCTCKDLYGAREPDAEVRLGEQQRVRPQHAPRFRQELHHLPCLPQGQHPRDHCRCKAGQGDGAAVIILTWLEESEIIEFGDYIIHYSFDASPDHLAGDHRLRR